MTRRQHRSFSFKKPVILAGLALFMLAWAGLVSLSTGWEVAHGQEIAGPAAVVPSHSLIQPQTGRDTGDTIAIGHPFPVPQDSALNPFPQWEPTVAPPPVAAATATPIPTPAPAEPTEAPATIPGAEIQHVVIISIDGLRPDALAQAHTPTLDKLIAKGSYSPKAQTVSLSITLVSHASMLSGMTPDKHGILWGVPYIGWPGMNGPTVFNVAHDAGLRTGMVFGKEKLHYLVLSNSVDELFGANVHDPEVKEEALEIIQDGLPNLLFIHFPDTDRVGHAYGWLSTNQLLSVTFADSMIEEIIEALEEEDYLDRTLLIVTSDHGGHDRTHGDDCPEDRTIPWLAVGPGVPSGQTLNCHIDVYDTAATAAYALGLPIPENWDGHPVMEIFP